MACHHTNLISTIIVVILLLQTHCNAQSHSVYNRTLQPLKTAELIQSRSEGNTAGSAHVNEAPRYEIFIKQDKSVSDQNGVSKTKTFVESENHEKQERRSPPNDKHNKAVPLSIASSSVKVDPFQNKNIEDAYSGKPYNVSVSSTSEYQKYSPHTTGDTYKGYASPIRNDREKSSSPNVKETFLSNVSYKEIVSEPKHNVRQVGTQAYTQNQSLNFTIYLHPREENSFHVRPALQQGRETPSTEKVLIYEPDSGIFATQLVTQNSKRFATQGYSKTNHQGYRKPADDLQLGESRIPVNTGRDDEEEGLRYDNQETGPARQQDYHEQIRPARTRPNRYPDSVDRVPEEEYSSHTKKLYGSEEPRPYEREPLDLSSISSTGLPYEPVGDRRPPTRVETTTTLRPDKYNSYLGFPESYVGSAQGNLKPITQAVGGSLPVSACPTVFKYTDFRDGRWYAEVYLTTEEVLIGVRLDIILSFAADLMTVDSAEVKSPDNKHFTVLSLKKRLRPGIVETFQVSVKYSQYKAAPVVQTISLNGRMICPSRTGTLSKTTKRPVYVFPGDLQEEKRTTERYNRPIIVNEYATTTRRTTPKATSTTRRTTPAYIANPNPDAYESPDTSYMRPATKKPNPNRPSFANQKPSPENRPGGLALGHGDRRPIVGSGGDYNFESNPTLSGTIASHRPFEKDSPVTVSCGTLAILPKPLITNGQMTSRGQWPWHIALYKSTGPNLNYSCGGTLVTDRHVITAAHCVTRELTSTPVDPKVLTVYLGKYHLFIWAENGIATREVARINIHPTYNSTTFAGDLAVLTLSSKVDFTDFIRPACLWDKRNTSIDHIVGLQGTVVGWGFDTTKELTEELKQAQMPVVDHTQCLWSYPEFFPKFTTNMTYCAGFKNGTSVCNGDSGGGMFFRIKVNREERWFLRGLVSISASMKGVRICDTHHYVVFTDVAKYLPWVEDVISRG